MTFEQICDYSFDSVILIFLQFQFSKRFKIIDVPLFLQLTLIYIFRTPEKKLRSSMETLINKVHCRREKVFKC